MEAARSLQAWTIEQIAASLPDEYRSSFLNRNPINRDLLVLAR